MFLNSVTSNLFSQNNIYQILFIKERVKNFFQENHIYSLQYLIAEYFFLKLLICVHQYDSE